MQKRQLFLLALFSLGVSYAQVGREIDTADFEKRIAFLAEHQLRFETFQKNLKSEFPGKLRKELKNYYKKANEGFIRNVEKKKLIFDPVYTNYLNALLDTLVGTNSELKHLDLKLLLSKDGTPNALNIGNGIIILNVGLFKFLQNSDQLLSVICHEIGHELPRHVAHNIVALSTLQLEGRQKARYIKKQRYNRQARAFEALKNLLYVQGEKHRIQEMEADSIGYELFRKVSANYSEFTGALGLLRDLDSLQPFVLERETYPTFFDLPEQPFQEEWVKNESFEDYDYSHFKEKIEKDSSKTHPDMVKRIEVLKSVFPELNEASETETHLKNDPVFDELQQMAKNNDIGNLHYLGKYGASIYLTLKKLSDDPKNSYYLKWLGINFQAIYSAKKKYQLNRHLEHISPENQSDSYQFFLNFMWNLDIDEIKAIADHYS